FKKEIADVVLAQKELKVESTVEMDVYKKVNLMLESLYEDTRNLANMVKTLPENEEERAKEIANSLMPLSEQIAKFIGEVEVHMPNEQWPLPSYFDMLFLR
ncbi:hypothetical protein, partial [Bacteriovorax sp. DB6_IX]